MGFWQDAICVGDDDVMLGGNQDDDMMSIQMEFGLDFREATQRPSLHDLASFPQPCQGSVSDLRLLWSPLEHPAVCPANCLKRGPGQAVHYLGT